MRRRPTVPHYSTRAVQMYRLGMAKKYCCYCHVFSRGWEFIISFMRYYCIVTHFRCHICLQIYISHAHKRHYAWSNFLIPWTLFILPVLYRTQHYKLNRLLIGHLMRNFGKSIIFTLLRRRWMHGSCQTVRRSDINMCESRLNFQMWLQSRIQCIRSQSMLRLWDFKKIIFNYYNQNDTRNVTMLKKKIK